MAISEVYVSALAAGGGDGAVGTPFTWAEMVTDINAGGKAGNRYNVKADGTYARTTTTDTISGSGSSTSPIIIRGYAATIGDGYQGRANGNGALVTTNMPSVTYTTGRLVASGTFIVLENINYTTAFVGSGLGWGNNGAIIRCVVTNSGTTTAAAFGSGSTSLALLDCDFLLTGASGATAAINLTGTGDVFGCRITGKTGPGLTGQGVRAVLGCTIYRCSNGINVTATGAFPLIAGNTIVNCSGDGIDIVTGSTVVHRIVNNLITDNGGFGIDGVSAGNAILAAYNRLDRNTAGNVNSATDWLAGSSYSHNTTSATQANEYVDADADDYRLKATSPALAAGHFAYASVGSLQREAAGGGPLIAGRLVR